MNEQPEQTQVRAQRKLSLQRIIKDQRFLFLIVGGINTLAQYLWFVLFETLRGGHFGQLGYMVSLVFSYFLAMIGAFYLHRRFVFRVSGKLLLDFFRFVLVNLFGFGINAAVLPLAIEIGGLAPIYAQAGAAVLVAIANYFGHKHISFRRTMK